MKKFTYFTIANSIFFLVFTLINTFGIAYLYSMRNDSLYFSVGLLVVVRVLYILLLPLLAKYIGILGSKTSIIISLLFLLISNIFLIFAETSYIYLAFWVLANSLAYVFYFVPIFLYTSKYTSSETRGIQFGKIYSLVIFVTAFAPYLSGAMISNYSIQGFVVLLILLISVSILFVNKLQNIKFVYSGEIHKLRLNKSLVRGSWIESCHYSTRNLSIFWTLFIFVSFNENFENFGILLTAITLFSAFLNLLLGKYLNKHNRKDLVKTQIIFSPFSWIFRILAFNPISIFFADAFHSLNGFIRESAVETTAYDLITRDGHQEILDEKIVYREIVINIAIIITLVSGIWLATTFGIKSSFILGIIISFGYLLI